MKRLFLRLFKAYSRHFLLNSFIFVLSTIVISTFLILQFESNYPDSEIQSLTDAIWWSAVGISTIGIGNVVPVSDFGRYLTLFLMVVGVVIFSLITAEIAAYFTETKVRKDLTKVEHDIEGEIAVDDREIEAKLNEIELKVNKLEKGKK